MRPTRLILATVFLSAAALAAQQPAAQQPPAQPDPSQLLDQVLNYWERSMTALKSFSAKVERKMVDKAFQSTEVWSGEAKFLKGQPGAASRASLWLSKVMNPPPAPNVEVPFEKFICTGNFLYQYSQATKEIIVHDMPQNPGGQIADDNILAFLFGRRADEAKKRYHMSLVAPPDANQGKWYYFISIKPRLQADGQDFSEARLVLWTSAAGDKGGLPCQFWFRQPNGNEVTWSFPSVSPNAEIAAQEFAAPQTPAGWKMNKAPQPQPKIRN